MDSPAISRRDFGPSDLGADAPPPSPQVPTLMGSHSRNEESWFPSLRPDLSSLTCSKVIKTGLYLGGAATVIALDALNYNGWGKSAVVGATLALTAGGLIQSTIQSPLPRALVNRVKDGLADYITPTFLTIVQIYNNLPSNRAVTVKEGIFSGLNGLYGMALAAMVHTLWTRKLSETPDAVPLSRDLGTESSIKFKLTLINTARQRAIWNLAKGVLGIGLTTAGALFSQVFVVRDFGIIVTADACMQLLSEVWLKRLKPKQQQINTDYVGPNQVPKELQVAYTVSRVFQVLAHALPGFLIVGAGAAAHAGLEGVSIPLYVLVGMLLGGKSFLELARFTEVPMAELTELKPKRDDRLSVDELPGEHLPKPPLSKWQKAATFSKWFFGTALVGGFLGLGIAGLNAQTGKFEDIDSFDRAALAAFGIGLYGSYAIAEFARRKFERISEKKRLINSLYFYTHYSPGIPLIFLYVMMQQQIGDKSLNEYTDLRGVLSCIAYFSLGWGVGNEANNRGESATPRILHPLPAALLGKFLGEELTGQV